MCFAAREDLATFKYRTYAGMLKGSNSIYFNGQPYHVGAAALADWQAVRLAEITRGPSFVSVTNRPLKPKSFVPPIQLAVSTSEY